MINLVKTITARFQMAKLENELRQLNDRTLADLGIERKDIRSTVRAVFEATASGRQDNHQVTHTTVELNKAEKSDTAA